MGLEDCLNMLLPCFRNMISAFGPAFLVYFPNVTERVQFLAVLLGNFGSSPDNGCKMWGVGTRRGPLPRKKIETVKSGNNATEDVFGQLIDYPN